MMAVQQRNIYDWIHPMDSVMADSERQFQMSTLDFHFHIFHQTSGIRLLYRMQAPWSLQNHHLIRMCYLQSLLLHCYGHLQRIRVGYNNQHQRDGYSPIRGTVSLSRIHLGSGNHRTVHQRTQHWLP